MKRFMATYIGTATAADKGAWSKLDPAERAERAAKGMAAWAEWMARNSDKIVDAGTPLGKTKRASADGIYQYANGKPAEICRVGFAPRPRSGSSTAGRR